VLSPAIGPAGFLNSSLRMVRRIANSPGGKKWPPGE
jgi:hypothetical protein